jgi:hypothetical protein
MRTNYPASAQGITAAIFIVAFKMDDGTLSAVIDKGVAENLLQELGLDAQLRRRR